MEKRRKRKVRFDHEKRNIFIFLFFVLFMGVGYSQLYRELDIRGNIRVQGTNPRTCVIKAVEISGSLISEDGMQIVDDPLESIGGRAVIKNIYLDDYIHEPNNLVDSFDISEQQDESVKAFVTNNEEEGYYDLYIQGNGALIANQNSQALFAIYINVDQIHNLEVLDTSNVTSMMGMFYGFGNECETVTLNLGDNFDTSKVTDMSYMFAGLGLNATTLSFDLGNNFDTSKVTDMTFMFAGLGSAATTFTLDLKDKFDTSTVTNMTFMFASLGSNATTFNLDLGDKFDTRNVTQMGGMFGAVAKYSTNGFELNLGDKFDTSKVTDMSMMFSGTGSESPNFSLDLGDNFNTSNVTSMYWMFDAVGKNNPNFTLNLGSQFYTSKVTNMALMFEEVGYSNPNFTLDLGDHFDTSLVTNMSHMFGRTGHANEYFELDLSTFTFDNVPYSTQIYTGSNGMFYDFTSNNKIYVKDSAAQSWIVNISSTDALTTDNVLIKT